MSLVGRYEIATERKERQRLQESLRSVYGNEMGSGKSPLTVITLFPHNSQSTSAINHIHNVLFCCFLATRVEIHREH
jgi:hypothetical protein